jgi:hypothetical protein
MTGIAPLLRELERQGLEGLQPDAPQLAQQTSKEFERIKNFLTDYLNSAATPPQLART